MGTAPCSGVVPAFHGFSIPETGKKSGKHLERAELYPREMLGDLSREIRWETGNYWDLCPSSLVVQDSRGNLLS